MEYELIVADSSIELNERVNQKLSEGWRLYGQPISDPQVRYKDVDGVDQLTYGSYAQAVIKAEDGEVGFIGVMPETGYSR